MNKTDPVILLSFDVEEFDLPAEYKQHIEPEEQLSVSYRGTEALLPVLRSHGVNCTLFTTACYAIHFPVQVQQMAQQHEIASHTFYHSSFENGHLLQSRRQLEEISGKPVTGLRMPRMRKVSMKEIKEAGYRYDSSVNPTYLPGRYNNFHLPRTFYTEEGIIRLPTSVSPHLRIPLFWLAFKNLPYLVFKQLALQTLKKDGYVCLYFHPWEFTDISRYSIPGYTRKMCGEPLQQRLHQLIGDLKKEARFSTVTSFLQSGRVEQAE
jgi:peptidoglycan/xylan/chitin deacetylase (PgdA/CDA1 family)